ncbi:MAG: hypothetical protein AB1540_07295 [Bdellovibrionota bacterium]
MTGRCILLTVGLISFSLGFADVPAQYIGLDLDSGATTAPNNVPSSDVVQLLERKFSQEARPVLAFGDLKLGGRWNCRELFTESSGYTHHRPQSYQFEHYMGGLLEDKLHDTIKYYMVKDNELRGLSNAKPGIVNEVRTDTEGNLVMAQKDTRSGVVKSYTLCLRKYFEN